MASFIHCLQCSFGIFGIFEADESAVLQFLGIFVALYLSRHDLSVLGKHATQLLVSGANREVLHKQIGELVFGTTFHASVSLWLVEEHLERFPMESK